MSRTLLDLALQKQRLQMQSDLLREEWRGHVAGLAPVFCTGDRIAKGVRWLRDRPPLLIGGAVALLVARPRLLFRWTRRTIMAWRSWRRLRGWVGLKGAVE